jgi:hypothetical protein
MGTSPPDDSCRTAVPSVPPYPMRRWTGAMNTCYIIRAMVECVEAFNSPRNEGVCDLEGSTTLLLVFSMPALPTLRSARVGTCASQRLPGILTSAAMLGFKLAQIEILKMKLDEQKRLEQERANLIAELEAALSPEMALRVEAIVDRTRGTFMMPARAASLPKPAHVDAAEAEATRGSVHEVRQRSLRALSPCVPRCGAPQRYIAPIWQGPARPGAAAAAVASDEPSAAQVHAFAVAMHSAGLYAAHVRRCEA